MQKPIEFNDLPDDIESVKSALKSHIEWASELVDDLSDRQFNQEREEALVYCLRHALDLAQVALLSIDAKLPDSLILISRALFETLFWTRFVSLSDENAVKYKQSAFDELRRIARRNLGEGFARVVDTTSEEDRTTEILDSELLKEIPRRLRIEEVARAGGLSRLYINVYGFFSIYSHGVAFGLSNDNELDVHILASASTSLGCLQCINLITSDWIKWRKMTHPVTISRLLGVTVDAA